MKHRKSLNRRIKDATRRVARVEHHQEVVRTAAFLLSSLVVACLLVYGWVDVLGWWSNARID
ncbi:hypothetical protein [Tautonia marina]|uniref:hypothetical protein n=1 Tax=Tautonia marina TaxID=2653855 RepID=UPI0012609A45|nr:hypothetical protein [Tautonia marina]